MKKAILLLVMVLAVLFASTTVAGASFLTPIPEAASTVPAGSTVDVSITIGASVTPKAGTAFMYVNGVKDAATLAGKVMTYSFTAPSTVGETVLITAEVSDARNAKYTYNWVISVGAGATIVDPPVQPPVPEALGVGATCDSCHNVAELGHTAADCNLCHGPGTILGGTVFAGKADSAHYDLSCAGSGCHDNIATPAAFNDTLLVYGCDSCHVPWGNIYAHDWDNIADAHAVTDSCSNEVCHANELVSVHNGGEAGLYRGLDPVAKDCKACHVGVSDDITAVVKAGFFGDNAKCIDCHDGGILPLSHAGTLATTTAVCADCHGALVDSHAKADCAGCHARGHYDSAVTAKGCVSADCHAAIETANNKAVAHAEIDGVTCTDCHASGHDVPFDGVAGVSYVKADVDRGLYDGQSGARNTLETWTKDAWSGELADVTLDGTNDYADGEWMVCFKCHAGSNANIGAWNGGTYGQWNGLHSTSAAITVDSTVPNNGTGPASGSTYNWFSTDLAREFNPNNPSGHRVVANPDGTVAGWGFTEVYRDYTSEGGLDKRLTDQNGNKIASWTMAAPAYNSANQYWLWQNINQVPASAREQNPIIGLTDQSVLKCSDCHTGQVGDAAGPHGSTTSYLLDETWNKRDWKAVVPNVQHQMTGNNAYICAKCHAVSGPSDSQTATSNLSTSRMGLARTHYYVWAANETGHFTSWGCGSCHTAIPHGWKRPRLLVSTDDDYGTPYLWSRVVGGNDNRTNTNNRGGWRRMPTNMARTNTATNYATAPASANSARGYAACESQCRAHGAAVTTYLP